MVYLRSELSRKGQIASKLPVERALRSLVELGGVAKGRIGRDTAADGGGRKKRVVSRCDSHRSLGSK
jgi:hypothetical protein